MSQRAIAASTPTTLLQRVVTWWLAQVKHALPPTIFFFDGFNLILLTKRLILQEHGIEFSGFFTAIVAALLVGKAVLVTDNLPFMRRFDGAPMIQPILFKSAIYWLCVLIVRLGWLRSSSVSSLQAAQSTLSATTSLITFRWRAFCQFRYG